MPRANTTRSDPAFSNMWAARSAPGSGGNDCAITALQAEISYVDAKKNAVA